VHSSKRRKRFGSFYGGRIKGDRRKAAEMRIAADMLEIEITENVVLDIEDAARAAMKALRATGICLAVDDFGTGDACLMQRANPWFNTIATVGMG
jgi:EAL domain-containing protein (putative c-di-GMP-specific phosphodiesterase class I)